MKNQLEKVKELQQFSDSKFSEYNLGGWHLIFQNREDLHWLNVRTNNVTGIMTLAMKLIIIPVETIMEFKIHTLKDIFLHELAHAISKEAHTKKFREAAKQIGCQGFKASNNRYLFDMYGTYKVTPQQEIKCMVKWFKENN